MTIFSNTNNLNFTDLESKTRFMSSKITIKFPGATSSSKERLEFLKNHFNFSSVNSMTKAWEVPASSIQNILGDRSTSLSVNIATKITESDPSINLKWLITGNGTPFNYKDTSVTNSGIGDRFRIIRLREEMSQKEFAEALGCSRVTITNIELSRHQPSLKTLIRLRKQFKVPYNYSIEGNKSTDIEKKESDFAHKIEIYEMERVSMQNQIEGLVTQIDMLKQLNTIYKGK
jgi:transcriptional regulator with XRE-family HTH domain